MFNKKYMIALLVLLLAISTTASTWGASFNQGGSQNCVDFSTGYADNTVLGPSYSIGGLNFVSLGSDLFINQVDSSVIGLQFPESGLSIEFPQPASQVFLSIGAWASPSLTIEAIDSGGTIVDSTKVPNINSLHSVNLSGADIVRVVITGGQNEGVLVTICADITQCVGFEDQPLGMVYVVGDTFTDSGVDVFVEEFQFPDGTWTNLGKAEVQNGGTAGGTNNELQVNNVNLRFSFGTTIAGLTMRFGEYGGNLNIDINGDFVNFDNFADIDGKVIGGVSVSVVNGFGNDTGILTLSGSISDFVIGGVELWIDDVCLPSCEGIGFEQQGLGSTYVVGDTFTDSGVDIFAEDFQWGNGIWTNTGYSEVQNGGAAGGTNNELQVNNVNLRFKFGMTVSALTTHFGEYGGNLNIDINGDFVNFDNFADIDGKVIGGVTVSVINGFGNDMGTLSLSGSIGDFVIGGQELWIDDICPTP